MIIKIYRWEIPQASQLRALSSEFSSKLIGSGGMSATSL